MFSFFFVVLINAHKTDISTNWKHHWMLSFSLSLSLALVSFLPSHLVRKAFHYLIEWITQRHYIATGNGLFCWFRINLRNVNRCLIKIYCGFCGCIVCEKEVKNAQIELEKTQILYRKMRHIPLQWTLWL